MTTTPPAPAPPVDPADDAPDPARRRWTRSLLVLLVLLLAAAAAFAVTGLLGPRAGGPFGWQAGTVEAASVDGLADGDVLNAETVLVTTAEIVAPAGAERTLRVTLDGAPVDVVEGRAVLGPEQFAALGEGEHVLAVTVGARSALRTDELTFSVDTVAPTIELPVAIEAAGRRAPLTVDVRVDGADRVSVDGGEVGQGEDGQLVARYEQAPDEVVVSAVDAAGNTAVAGLPVVVRFPGGRAVHTTPSAWRYAPKREPVIAMLEAGLIDAVQMDIKDELGDVSWDTDVEWADLSGAEDFNRNFDMAAAIETIHGYGARVIGRLVVYRDHRLATWAWESGRHDLVVQATDGTPYAGRYGEYAFTNFAHPEVQQYNLDIALEAAELGFDDVLYDYIRRPDGAIEKLVVPGLGERTPEEAVVEVMATAYPLLRERGLWVGASVFGIAVDRPTQMAQDIGLMAPHVDYIAPMVYPNHWNLGEYGVPVPEDAPYDIVERSLTLYREALAGTDTALMPWLQDFGGYGEAEVRAQIDATEVVTGERWFLLWASSATYTDAALDPIPGMPSGHPASSDDE